VWQRLSAGPGAKGQRGYDWAWVTIGGNTPGCRWLLIRRTPRTGELAFCRCYASHPVPLAALVKVAGRRWTSWYRWVTLAMLAAAFLTIAAAAEHARQPAPAGQIPLTRNEIAALFGSLIIEPTRDTRHRLRWSAWRRRRQHRAKTCHYQRQASQP